MSIVRSTKTVVLALAVSGSSLAAFVYLGLAGFEPEALAASPTALELDIDDEVYAVPRFTIPDEIEVETPLVTVPDISGMSVPEAREQLRAFNLVLRPIAAAGPLDDDDDDENFWISPTQRFGQQVWAGTEVSVQVNYRAPRIKSKKYAMGY